MAETTSVFIPITITDTFYQGNLFGVTSNQANNINILAIAGGDGRNNLRADKVSPLFVTGNQGSTPKTEGISQKSS